MAIPNYTPLMPGQNGTGRRDSNYQDADNSNYNLMQQQTTIELQKVLSDKGILAPQVDATTVPLLNTAENIGRIIYNKTTGKFMGNEAGTFKTFTTS